MSYDDSYGSYDSGPRDSFGVAVLLGVIVLSAVLVFIGSRFVGGGGTKTKEAETAGPALPETDVEVVVPLEKEPVLPLTPEDTVEETPEDILKDLGIGVVAADPARLVEQIGRNLEAGEVREAAEIIGRDALNAGQLKRLHKLASDAQLKLNMTRPVSEIGELEMDRRARWALNLEDDWGSRIYFDLLREARGWRVQKMTLPAVAGNGEPARAVLIDALGITDAFLQAALEQNFETAKSFVDTREVSDAKIAGLCIVFEEGDYRLKEREPLRAVFNRKETASFIANVETPDGSDVAQFGVIVQRDGADAPWRVTEINLDRLLADYADRVAGGDVYFTPLIRNPKGGDTLILYFGFDEDTLSPRTERQLEIVSLLLQTDPNKTLTLSGHTDAKGSDEYNQALSSRRAEIVRQFLVDSGVDPQQIKTEALGKSRPRRPNTTEDGQDSPEGRRANRRTEIYLDF